MDRPFETRQNVNCLNTAALKTNLLSNWPPDESVAFVNSPLSSGHYSSEASIAAPLFASPATSPITSGQSR